MVHNIHTNTIVWMYEMSVQEYILNKKIIVIPY